MILGDNAGSGLFFQSFSGFGSGKLTVCKWFVNRNKVHPVLLVDHFIGNLVGMGHGVVDIVDLGEVNVDRIVNAKNENRRPTV